MIEIPKKKGGKPRKRPDTETLARLYAEYTTIEIAEMYDTTPATVRVWASKARREEREKAALEEAAKDGIEKG